MKILLVSNYQPPHMGGIEFATGSLKRCWIKDGHDVTMLTTDIPKGAVPSTSDNVRLPAWNHLEKYLQINTPVIPPWNRHHIRELVSQHDVINTHSVAPSLSVLTMHEAIRQKKPLVVTQHVGVIPLKLKVLSLWQKHVICKEAKRAVTSGAYLTFVGKAVREWFENTAKLDKRRIRMTPAGIDQDTYHFVDDAERETLRLKWKLSDSKLNVLFVGRFYDKKGVHLLREIAEANADIQFSMVGGGPVKPREWELPNVIVHKFVSNEELRELYGSHDLFIMPSYGEGWPAVVPQSMICGTRCLISEECFTGYQKDSDKFIVVKRNKEAITQALKLYDPKSADRKACSDYAQNTWDWMATARVYLELFEDLRR